MDLLQAAQVCAPTSTPSATPAHGPSGNVGRKQVQVEVDAMLSEGEVGESACVDIANEMITSCAMDDPTTGCNEETSKCVPDPPAVLNLKVNSALHEEDEDAWMWESIQVSIE